MHTQLYYPYISPKIDNNIIMSLMHWDSISRMFPKKESVEASFYQDEFSELLEQNGLLTSVQINESDIENCLRVFDRIIRATSSADVFNRNMADTLVEECKSAAATSYIFRGKSNEMALSQFGRYFDSGFDDLGNSVFFCSRKTCQTYLTIMAFFINERLGHDSVITDVASAQPLFIFLKNTSVVDKNDSNLFLSEESEALAIRNAFYIPMLTLLGPNSLDFKSILTKIVELRSDDEVEDARKRYLNEVNSMVGNLKKCTSDSSAIEVAAGHKTNIIQELTIIIDACKQKGIPVNNKFHAHTDNTVWNNAARLGDASLSLIDVFKDKSMWLLKLVPHLANIPTSINYYNNTIIKSKHVYPILVQERLSPTLSQATFRKLRELHKINLW